MGPRGRPALFAVLPLLFLLVFSPLATNAVRLNNENANSDERARTRLQEHLPETAEEYYDSLKRYSSNSVATTAATNCNCQKQQACHIPARYFTNDGQFCSTVFAHWLRPGYCRYQFDKLFLTHWNNYISKTLHDDTYDATKRALALEHKAEVAKRVEDAPFYFALIFIVEYYFPALILVIVPFFALLTAGVKYIKTGWKIYLRRKRERRALVDQGKDVTPTTATTRSRRSMVHVS